MAIARVVAGESPTLLHTEKANELIDAINSLKAMTVSPTSAGQVIHSDGNTVIQVNATSGSEGGASPLKPFELADASEGGATKMRIAASTVTGLTPPGFSAGDTPPYVITVSGSGRVWAKIVRNTSSPGTGVSSVAIETGSSVPSNTTTNYYVPIGSYSVSSGKVTVSNSRYGPIDGSFCRNWFSNPPAFTLNLS